MCLEIRMLIFLKRFYNRVSNPFIRNSPYLLNHFYTFFTYFTKSLYRTFLIINKQWVNKKFSLWFPIYYSEGFTWYCNHTELHPLFLIGYVVAGVGFYSYYIHQGNKDRKKYCMKKVLCSQKDIIFFLRWVQFRVGAIPRL